MVGIRLRLGKGGGACCECAVCPERECSEEDGRRFVESICRETANVPEENASVDHGKTSFVLVFEGPALDVLFEGQGVEVFFGCWEGFVRHEVGELDDLAEGC